MTGLRGQSITQQECIPVGCVPPAAVAAPGGSPQGTIPEEAPPGGSTPQGKHPPRRNHPPEEAPPPGRKHPPLPVNRMTNRCKNITLRQTSFAGGINVNLGLEATQCTHFLKVTKFGIFPGYLIKFQVFVHYFYSDLRPTQFFSRFAFAQCKRTCKWT